MSHTANPPTTPTAPAPPAPPPNPLTFKLQPLPAEGGQVPPGGYLNFWEVFNGKPNTAFWHSYPRGKWIDAHNAARNRWYQLPKGLYELQTIYQNAPHTPIALAFNAADGSMSFTIPNHGKDVLLAQHNAGHFNNAPLWKSQAEAARHIIATTPALAESQWHLAALRNDCIHSIMQAIYDGLQGEEVFNAILNDSAIAIADLAHDSADCYFVVSPAGVVSRHPSHPTTAAAETAYKAFAARVRADKDATTPTLRHDMSVAQFKAAFPPPPPPVEPPAPPPPPAPEVSSVSITATSTNYRTGNSVTASVVRVRATGGTIHWQIKQPGRLGWTDLQTDDSPPVAVTGSIWTPTAEGMYRAEIRGAVAPNGDTIPTAQSAEFTITPA